ncbi:MAG TPA: TonB-dependent receptor [Terracidiphilus sp.]|nr:TonB-dependent receptor [Terracidiphilus sp.]
MQFRRGLAITALCTAIMLLFPALAAAQSGSAQIHGSLTDRTGAVLTGATVTVRDAATGQSSSVTTNSTGNYSITGLAPGRYTLRVNQSGFSQLVTTVRLRAGQDLDEPLVLGLASVVQQVTVSSGPTDDGLTSKTIREGGARDLGEATSNLAGVDMVRKAAVANDIAIRGMFHSNIAMSFDGERMYGACTSQMDPAAYHVDLSEVDHVDVVKGPFDVTTQGSMGGYVKVITKTPDASGFLLRTNVSTGSYGYYNPSGTLQIGGDNLHSLFGYSYRTSEFYRDGDGNNVASLASYRNGNENLQAFRTQSIWTKLAFQPTANQRGEIAYTRQQSGEVLYPYMMMDGIFDNGDRFDLRYDILKPHGWVNAAHGQAYLDKVNHLMDNRLRASAGSLPNSMSAQVVSFTSGARLDLNLAGGFTTGYEFHRRYWNSAGYMIMTMMGMPMQMNTHALPGVVAWLNGAYLTYRRALGQRVLFTGGSRFDHVSTDASQANSALYQAFHGTSATSASDSGVSGNARISWQATHLLELFAGVGSNIRFPDPQELFYASDAMMMGSSMGSGWVGNPLLTHPRDTEYDLGFTAKNQRFTFSPLIYFSKLDNDITLYGADRMQMVSGVNAMMAQSYQNVQAHQWGGELTAGAPIAGGFAVRETLNYTRGTKVPQPANNILSPNLFQVPPIRSQLAVRYERHALYTEGESIVTGRQDHVDTDENEQTTAGFSVFNVKLGYAVNRFHITGGVNNLLAREYTTYLSYARNPYTNGIRLPEPGRNFFVNLSYTFGSGEE